MTNGDRCEDAGHSIISVNKKCHARANISSQQYVATRLIAHYSAPEGSASSAGGVIGLCS